MVHPETVLDGAAFHASALKSGVTCATVHLWSRSALRWSPAGRFTSSFGSSGPGPQTTWLSPLNRRQTSFNLTNDARQVPGNRWQVPAPFLSSARIEITPEEITGYSVVHFDFADALLALR